MPKNIVWTAVIAAASSVASVIAALVYVPNLVMAFGFTAVTAALLSTRER